MFKHHVMHGRESDHFPDGLLRHAHAGGVRRDALVGGLVRVRRAGDRRTPPSSTPTWRASSATELAQRDFKPRRRWRVLNLAEAIERIPAGTTRSSSRRASSRPGRSTCGGRPQGAAGRPGGKRALDVGTFDGFWAFEMERRGADVVAIDVPTLEAAEWPEVNRERLEATAREWGLELGRGFRLAAEALGSSVERIECHVQELARDRIGGPVDFVFSGAILLHLRDPVGALERHPKRARARAARW